MTQPTKNFLVCKASAGSGKTFKLVNEYLTLCLLSESRYKFGKILAITFTNKAASEMKERIIDHLRALSSEPDSPNYHPSWMKHYQEITGLTQKILRERAKHILESILHNYTSLAISTIDKFTHKLIRSFARDLRLSADFDIELDPKEPLSKSADELISMAGQDEEVTEILENYVDFLINEGSNWQFEKGLKHFGKQLLDEEASLHIEKLTQMSHEDFKKTFSFLTENIQKHESKLTTLSDSFFELIQHGNLDIEYFSYVSKSPYRHFSTIRKKDFTNSKLKFGKQDLELLTHQSFIKPKLQDKIDPALKNKIDQSFIGLNDILEKQHPKYIFYKLLRKNIYNLSLIKEFSNKLNEINQTDNTILIGEFNKIISEVVKNDPAPFIYERIGEKYHHILIDEFQDTSVLQFNNLLPLIENCLSNSHKCLIVGDPKQAIYRWRGGDTDQFIQLPQLNNEVTPEIKATIARNHFPEELNFNYRSGKNIVEFNNIFFQSASALLDEKYSFIYSSLKQEPVHEGGYVEFHLLEPDKTKGDEAIWNLTLEKIQECLTDGFNYSDIVLLTRNKKEGVYLAEQLHSLKIPVVSSESLLLSGSPEVQFIMYFIRYLAHPNDPIAGFKTLEYHQRIHGNINKHHFEYYKRKENKYLFDVDRYFLDAGISIKANELLSHTSYQLLLETVRIFFPKTQNSYLRFLIEYVFNNWKNKPVDVVELVEWWEENQDKLSIQNTDKNDAIRLMTIHASKGLQFPVVIFPFAEWRSQNGREWLWVDLKNEDIPLKTTIVKSDAAYLDRSNYNQLKTEEKDKSDLDDLNLMYVALTRPEKRLYILAENSNTMLRYGASLKNALIEQDQNIWTKGEKEVFISHREPSLSSFSITYENDKLWQERLRLSTEKASDKEEQEEIYRTKKAGILLHQIFEKYADLDAALIYLQQMAEQDQSVLVMQKELSMEIKNVYSHEFIGQFLKNNHVLSECSIVDELGVTYRPDKVLIENDSVVICDFKTGSEKAEHAHQLETYAKLFEEMNFKSIKKYLFYTKEAKLKEV